RGGGWGTVDSRWRGAVGSELGVGLLLYSPASLTSIRANGVLPSSRLLSDAGASVVAMGLPPRDEAPEDGAILEAVALGVLGGVLLHTLADRMAFGHVEAGHLALVANQPGDLAVDRVGDIDDDVGRVRAP